MRAWWWWWCQCRAVQRVRVPRIVRHTITAMSASAELLWLDALALSGLLLPSTRVPLHSRRCPRSFIIKQS